jgi:NAD(P)-dependent dehydrogenase (short-subunit alcohol dehydrogenase family)
LILRSSETPEKLEEDLLDTFRVNVIGQINLFNHFLPLILKGKTKKVITLGTGLADINLTAKYNLELAAPYSISKAATNMAVAKYHATYGPRDVLFMSICPGFVESGHQDGCEL